MLVLGVVETGAEDLEPELDRGDGKKKQPEPEQSEAEEAEMRYRQTASALEAFVQTSTIGEFDARLRLLSSFHSHLSLQLSAAATGGEGVPEGGLPQVVMAATAAALANTVHYYRQFSPAVRRWIEAGLTPLERDLQVRPASLSLPLSWPPFGPCSWLLS
jgi:midasin (ATPase involved in ribosome maturation)